MATRRRPLSAQLLAGLALASAAFALPASCTAPDSVPPAELVAAMADAAASLRDAFEEHQEWSGKAELDPSFVRQEQDDARRLREQIGDLVGATRTLDGCQQEGWSRETVVISDLVGQLEKALDDHVRQVAEADTQLELRVEEAIYAAKIKDLLGEIDEHIDAAEAEAAARPRLRCGRAPVPSRRHDTIPLI